MDIIATDLKWKNSDSGCGGRSGNFCGNVHCRFAGIEQKNRFSGEKAEQIEQEMRDKQAGHPLSYTDQEKVLERLALYAELYKHPLNIAEVVSETGYVRVKYNDGREERFYRVPDEV